MGEKIYGQEINGMQEFHRKKKCRVFVKLWGGNSNEQCLTKMYYRQAVVLVDPSPRASCFIVTERIYGQGVLAIPWHLALDAGVINDTFIYTVVHCQSFLLVHLRHSLAFHILPSRNE